MKKLVFLFLLAASAFGQSTAGPFVISSGTSACAQIDVSGQSAVGISVTGTFSATLQPEVAIQGQAATNIQVTPSTSSTAQSTITAAGNYTASVGGYSTFLVCVTAYTSGTATIRLNTVKTTASNGGTGAGGGGGGGSTAFSAITSGTNTTATMVLSGTSTLSTNSASGGKILLGDGNVNRPQLGFANDNGTGFIFDPTSHAGYWTDGTNAGGPLWGFIADQAAAGESALFVTTGVSGASWMGFSVDTLGVSAQVCTQCLIPVTGGLASSTNGTSATGTLTATKYLTATDCAVNSVSPAACAAAASGAFVVPTTTATYTVNTSAVTTNAHIFLQARTYTGGLPGTPTCVAPAVTSAVVISARTAATSFTFALPSTVGQTCWDYWIVSN